MTDTNSLIILAIIAFSPIAFGAWFIHLGCKNIRNLGKEQEKDYSDIDPEFMKYPEEFKRKEEKK